MDEGDTREVLIESCYRNFMGLDRICEERRDTAGALGYAKKELRFKFIQRPPRQKAAVLRKYIR